ncbi:MAG: FtsX-like permease family protein [Ilumatobacter sp.]
MRRLLREIRRAPVRILTSVFALALAVGAIGVFAIPTVSTSSLRDAAERDGIPDIILTTTAFDDPSLIDTLNAIGSVERAEPQVLFTTEVPGDEDRSVDVLGVDLDGQTMDVISVDEGRRPTTIAEVLVTEGTASVGDRFEIGAEAGATTIEVVGIGSTSFWNEPGLVIADLAGATAIGGEGVNRVVVRTIDDDADALRSTSAELRDALDQNDVALTSLPFEIANGEHPIEAEIEQISMLIGLLGIVAGIVGLILLASTTNTLIVERSREVAVMRALGATDRTVRRRLRRIALGIAAAATVIGLPLGIAISYVIARMVLQEFIGLTPGFAVSWPVLAASAAFALVGARVVAARSARRVTRTPLAEALRDRDAVPFGRRWVERIAASWSGGRLADRLALRNGLRNRGRSLAISLQLGSAVAALMIVASMATTITDFNEAELDPIRWRSESWVAGPGLDIPADVADRDSRSETGIEVTGDVLGWYVDVYGWEPDTQMIDRTVTDGRWFTEATDAVVSEGFAERVGIAIGDSLEVDLASGTASYDVVGLHGNRGREVYVNRTTLATDLGNPSLANRLYSLDAIPATSLAGVTGTTTFDSLDADDSGRTAILAIFGAIGVVVVSVAGLAVMSGLGVNLHERRHELATMQSLGARRRDLFGVLLTEVTALGVAGIGVGLIGGFFGGRAVARSFEASNAVEIGFTFADRAIPTVLGVIAGLAVFITAAMIRRVARRPVAETLRSAA